jgi:hypothetical protein
MAAYLNGEQRSLLEQLFALHERERLSLEHASNGSHAMLHRRAIKAILEAERYRLMALTQPSLFES